MDGAEPVGTEAFGGMTSRVVLALQSAREEPLGQQPASVQYVPAGQYSVGEEMSILLFSTEEGQGKLTSIRAA